MIFNSNLAIYTFNPADFKNDKRHTQNLFLLPIEQMGKTEITQINSEVLNFYDMGGFCQVRRLTKQNQAIRGSTSSRSIAPQRTSPPLLSLPQTRRAHSCAQVNKRV